MPREVVCWALRYMGVDEWIVSVIKAMYEGGCFDKGEDEWERGRVKLLVLKLGCTRVQFSAHCYIYRVGGFV